LMFIGCGAVALNAYKLKFNEIAKEVFWCYLLIPRQARRSKMGYLYYSNPNYGFLMKY
jgi:hypothetical protein